MPLIAKYVEKHPEEYKKYLEDQKSKKDNKIDCKIIINEK